MRVAYQSEFACPMERRERYWLQRAFDNFAIKNKNLGRANSRLARIVINNLSFLSYGTQSKLAYMNSLEF